MNTPTKNYYGASQIFLDKVEEGWEIWMENANRDILKSRTFKTYEDVITYCTTRINVKSNPNYVIVDCYNEGSAFFEDGKLVSASCYTPLGQKDFMKATWMRDESEMSQMRVEVKTYQHESLLSTKLKGEYDISTTELMEDALEEVEDLREEIDEFNSNNKVGCRVELVVTKF